MVVSTNAKLPASKLVLHFGLLDLRARGCLLELLGEFLAILNGRVPVVASSDVVGRAIPQYERTMRAEYAPHDYVSER